MTLCDEKCNECTIILHKNSKVLTSVLNKLYALMPGEVYKIVQEVCPNLTVCHDCRIDDFCHFDGCKYCLKKN